MVVPTKEFFPERYAGDHASAMIVFQRIKELMGMGDWHCEFVQRRSEEQELKADLSRSGVLGQTSSQGAAGTFFSPPEKNVVITYSASLLRDPEGLVATLSHELCHYLLAVVREEPPCTWKDLEPLTDLSAVLEGFGIFLCNSAFKFEQWTGVSTQGWSAKRSGYLNEAELGFALAISCVRNRLDVKIAARSLRPNPRQVFRDALDYVAALEEDEGGS